MTLAPPPGAGPPLPLHAPDPAPLRLHDPVFVSDLHLDERAPATLARFLRFVAHEAGAFAELLVLGDLFESWAGDDEDGSVAAAVAAALAAHAARGHPVFLMQGNRDLLLGRDYARRCGARLVADPVRAVIGATAVPALLAHGDQWCLADVAYMAFRAQVRSERVQAGFLAQPLPARRAFVQSARSHSEAAKRAQAMDIMDVDPEAAAAAVASAGATWLIHGHTHRPALHAPAAGGPLRCVLPDWDYDATPPRGGYLAIHDGAPTLVELAA